MIKKVLLNQQTPFWLIAISIAIGLTLPSLIQDGMFMDAMLYTSVSHNLSLGIGTFWFPQFSEHNIAGLSSFHEQPPLVFGIQALFYKVLGNSMYVERLYTFLTMCVSGGLIVYLWKIIFKNQENLKQLAWLPLILWITIPVCFWSYSNNMHENTMGIFTLCSVIFSIKAIESPKNQFYLFTLSGVSIFLATLSKGIPGFFPIVIPFLYWITYQNSKLTKTFFQTFVLLFIPAILYFILFLIPESKESLSIYLFKRALHRINEVPTVDNRFYILWRIFTELIPQLSLLLIFIILAKSKKIKIFYKENNRKSIFYILLGLSASAPLMLTLVQKGFYFVPALPFFSIGLSILIAPIIFNLIERIKVSNKGHKHFLIVSSALLIVVVVFSFIQKGKSSRNKVLLHDIYLIGEVVKKESIVSIPEELWNEWDLQCYLIRYYNISLEGGNNKQYFILDRNIKSEVLPAYEKVNINTLQYDLYKKE